jgi:protein TonB
MLRLFLVVAGALFVAAPAVQARPKGPTRAHASQPDVFSFRDYPGEALAARLEGRVEYEILVGPSGRIERCSIVKSSGAAVLDATTCRLLARRARFTPARDARGRPTSDTLTGAFTWRLPRS